MQDPLYLRAEYPRLSNTEKWLFRWGKLLGLRPQFADDGSADHPKVDLKLMIFR